MTCKKFQDQKLTHSSSDNDFEKATINIVLAIITKKRSKGEWATRLARRK